MRSLSLAVLAACLASTAWTLPQPAPADSLSGKDSGISPNGNNGPQSTIGERLKNLRRNYLLSNLPEDTEGQAWVEQCASSRLGDNVGGSQSDQHTRACLNLYTNFRQMFPDKPLPATAAQAEEEMKLARRQQQGSRHNIIPTGEQSVVTAERRGRRSWEPKRSSGELFAETSSPQEALILGGAERRSGRRIDTPPPREELIAGHAQRRSGRRVDPDPIDGKLTADARDPRRRTGRPRGHGNSPESAMAMLMNPTALNRQSNELFTSAMNAASSFKMPSLNLGALPKHIPIKPGMVIA